MKFTIAVITAFLGMALATPMDQHHGGNKKHSASASATGCSDATPAMPSGALPSLPVDDLLSMGKMEARMPPPMGSPTPSEDVDGHKGKGHKKGGKKGSADATAEATPMNKMQVGEQPTTATGTPSASEAPKGHKGKGHKKGGKKGGKKGMEDADDAQPAAM
ncbi:hypothetical protein VFPPC_13152 [Pochonia chlamydosporia 170]|uniref:Uncharacterized protein n=1 Tax=Pochonia chlamydosporia 170 TaxID=1380566 RepID=A0A179GA04_METCM|nr:hypothetical protein VFPPC_13152 [Pochonia chlamydosporia 170]OAQ74213.1 hypothetical protein VFPPC_13152 [Pochonia chlamydosporia 170]